MAIDIERGHLWKTDGGWSKRLCLDVRPEHISRLDEMNVAWRAMLLQGKHCSIPLETVKRDCDRLVAEYQTPEQFISKCAEFMRKYLAISLEHTPLATYIDRYGGLTRKNI